MGYEASEEVERGGRLWVAPSRKLSMRLPEVALVEEEVLSRRKWLLPLEVAAIAPVRGR